MRNILCKLSNIFLCCICTCILMIIPAEASEYALGDVNQDSVVNASDALSVLKASADLLKFNDYQMEVADVNRDEFINSGDALQILKVAAKIDIFKIEAELPVGQEYVIDKIYDAGAYVWEYEINPDTGITVEKDIKELPDGSVPGDMAEQVYTITASEPGTYEIKFRLVHIGDSTQKAKEERVYVITVNDGHVQINKFEVELPVGQEYVIDKIYDAGAYVWEYEINPDIGITVEKDIKELPDGSVPGDMAEQVYTVTANEPGAYELKFRLVHIGDPTQKIKEERIYNFSVK